MRVVYLADRGVLCVNGIPTPFPAGSLRPLRQGDMLAVAAPHDDTLLCAYTPFSAWTGADGASFVSADAVFAYLTATCRRAPGRLPSVAVAAGEAIPAGMPVALSRQDGRLLLARSDTYALSFVIGLAETAAQPDFPATAVRSAVSRSDWSEIAGEAALHPGEPYFLGPAGGMTRSPERTSGLSLVRLGSPVSPSTFAFVPADPILL